jgi:uncharacterized phage-associated protein
MVKAIPGGKADALDATARETIDAVIAFYGDWHPQVLSDLTHAERPWRDARGNLPAGAYSTDEITHAAMAGYYEALPVA